MEGFADISDAVPVGIPAAVWLLGCMALIALAAGLVWWRTRKSAAEQPVSAPAPAAIVVARQGLANLRTDGLLLPAEPFTVRLTGIVRRFVEDALRLPALEQTSEEFLEAISRDSALPPVMRAELPNLLEQCDKVKFARQDMAPEHRLQAIEAASAVIEAIDREQQTSAANPEAAT